MAFRGQIILVLFIQTVTTRGPQLNKVYVSQERGVDRPSCGTQLQPCKSISAGVWRADNNAHVYIDGTGTQTSPYPCQSSPLKIQGIYANKSLSMIGVQSPVNVKCRDGLGIRLDHSNLNYNGTTINLTNIWFLGSPINAHDVNLQIDSCTFVKGASAVTLTQQSTGSLTILFTNSSCQNTSSCIIVNASKMRLKIPQDRLRIHFTNSNVTGTSMGSPTPPSNAAAIQVISSDDNPRSISCDIALQKAVFTDNQIGPQGVVNVLLYNGFLSLLLDNVSFFGNKFVSRIPPNMIVTKSRDIEVIINRAIFSTSTMGRVMRLDATNSSMVRILNSYFTGEQLASKGSVGLFYLDSEHLSEVFISNTTFSNIQTSGVGSCMSLKSGTAKVQIINSTFRNNHASCAGIFWMSVEELLVLVFQGCYFESIGADGPGGLASCTGKFVNITMVDSKVNGSHVHRSGGVFDIGVNGCGSQDEIWNANLVFKNNVIEHCFCIDYALSGWPWHCSGGVAAIGSMNGSITVQDSFFTDIMASASGGVLWAQNTNSSASASLSIEISNTVFKNSTTLATGGVIWAERVRKIFLDRVIIDSAIANSGPGGALFIEGENDMEINIVNSTFTNCVSISAAGILYLKTADKPLRMAISDSVFESSFTSWLPGGCIYLQDGQASVTFTNVTFRNCQSSGDRGGAVYLSTTGNPSEIVFHSCVFLDNTAPAGVGGALCIELPKDIIIDPGCTDIEDDLTTPHRVWNYKSEVQIIDTIFTNNTAGSGGAIAFTRGQHIIQGCTFRNNFASLRGGHIMTSSDSTSLRIYDSKFLQTRKTQVLNAFDEKICFNITSFIDTDSQGPLILHESSLESKPLGDVKPSVMVSRGGYVSFDKNTSLICPRGSDLEILHFTNTVNNEYKSHSCKISLSVFQFNCKACPLDSYSLQHGQSVCLKKIGRFQCFPCPFGAECLKNVAAKENYWGYQIPRQNPAALKFTNCPTGYCKHPDQGDPLQYNSCQGNRSGILCGQCKGDYTETLLSPSCRPKDECDDTWLWGVAVVMLLLMATYLVHKPRFSVFIRKEIFWFRKDNIHVEVPGHGEASTKSHDNGYLKIVFYFYQVANLLLISTSYNTIIESHLLQPVVGFFNFQFRFSSSGFLCPFPGLTVVTKELFLASQVFGVFIIILFCYICHVLVRKCKSLPSPNLGPYLGALLETMLLGYAVFANTALKLLRCTTIGEESRLFISGQVLCYQWWQYLLMVFVGVVVVPFILILGLGSYWLSKGSISVKGVLLGCALPLPYLVYRLASHLFCQQRQPSEESAEWNAYIEDVLFGAFRPREGDSYGALYWESVLTGRRLIIIIIYVSFSDPLCKQLLLTFVCVAILLHHAIVRPFRNAKANNIEMASLLGLITISIINTFKASFLTTGEYPKGPLHSSAQILDVIQIIILSVVPVICVLLVIACVVSQVVRLCTVIGRFCASCCGHYFLKESRPLLEPTDFNEHT